MRHTFWLSPFGIRVGILILVILCLFYIFLFYIVFKLYGATPLVKISSRPRLNYNIQNDHVYKDHTTPTEANTVDIREFPETTQNGDLNTRFWQLSRGNGLASTTRTGLVVKPMTNLWASNEFPNSITDQDDRILSQLVWILENAKNSIQKLQVDG